MGGIAEITHVTCHVAYLRKWKSVYGDRRQVSEELSKYDTPHKPTPPGWLYALNKVLLILLNFYIYLYISILCPYKW